MATKQNQSIPERQRGYVPSTPPKEKGGQGNQGMNPTPPPKKSK